MIVVAAVVAVADALKITDIPLPYGLHSRLVPEVSNWPVSNFQNPFLVVSLDRALTLGFKIIQVPLLSQSLDSRRYRY